MTIREKAILLKPGDGLLEKTARIIAEHPRIKELVVVTPSRRTLLFLSKELSKIIKKPFISPSMFSIEDYINFLYENHVTPALPLLTPLDAAYFIDEANQEAGLLKTPSLDTLLPWAFKFISDFEELYIEGVTAERLSEIDGLIQEESMPPSIRNKIAKFSSTYRLFYEKIRDKFSTRAVRYRKVSELDLDYFKRPHILLGFFALTNSEREIFKKILNTENSHFISFYHERIEKYLSEWGVKPIVSKDDYPSPKYHITRAHSIHGEVFAVKKLMEEGEKDTIENVIVLPDESHLFAVVNNINSKKRNISAGYPLIRTPFFALLSFIESLMQGREKGKYLKNDYLNVILHPYVKNTRFKNQTTITRILMHTIEKELKTSLSLYVSLKDIENSKVIELTLNKIKKEFPDIEKDELKNHLKHIHDTVIRLFESISSIGDFIDRVLQLVDFVSEKTTAKMHPFGSPFLEATLNALIEIKNSLLTEKALKDTRHYFYLLKTYIKTQKVPFKGTPLSGLQILGTLETRNLTFKRVFYLDMNEGIVPDVKKEDTVLSDTMRKYLGISTAKDRESITRYYFFNLIRSAEDVYLFYTTGNREPSRYIEMIKWEMEKEQNRLNAIEEEEATFEIALSHKDPTEVPKTTDMVEKLRGFPFSSTSLDVYLKCPLKFYYTYLLMPREEQEQKRAKNRLEVGNIVHMVLHEYFKDWIGKTYIIKDFDSEWRKIEAVLKKYYGDTTSNELLIQYEQIKYALYKLLQRHYTDYKGIKILELESKSIHRLKINNGTEVNVEGRFDRVHEQDGMVYIIDYKTGSTKEPQKSLPTEENRYKWDTIINSFQLPIYTMLYHWKTKIPYERIKAQMWSIKNVHIDDEFKKEFSMNEPGKAQAYEFALKSIIEEILNPDIPFRPVTMEKKSNCAYCPYKALCDRLWVKDTYGN